MTVTDGLATLEEGSVIWSKDSETAGQVPGCSGLLTWTEMTGTTGGVISGVERNGDPTSETREKSVLTIFLGGGQKSQKSPPHSSAGHVPSWLSPQAKGRCPDLVNAEVSTAI